MSLVDVYRGLPVSSSGSRSRGLRRHSTTIILYGTCTRNAAEDEEDEEYGRLLRRHFLACLLLLSVCLSFGGGK